MTTIRVEDEKPTTPKRGLLVENDYPRLEVNYTTKTNNSQKGVISLSNELIISLNTPVGGVEPPGQSALFVFTSRHVCLKPDDPPKLLAIILRIIQLPHHQSPRLILT